VTWASAPLNRARDSQVGTDSLWICDFAAVIPVLLIEFCVVWFCFVSVLFVYVFDFVMFLKWFCVFVIFFQKALAGGLE
jgi:hypothetical protein